MLIFNQGHIHGKVCFYFAGTEGFLRAMFCYNRALNGEYNNSWTCTVVSQSYYMLLSTSRVSDLHFGSKNPVWSKQVLFAVRSICSACSYVLLL